MGKIALGVLVAVVGMALLVPTSTRLTDEVLDLLDPPAES